MGRASREKAGREKDIERQKKEEREVDKLLAAADKEVEKRNKDMWTKEAIEEHGENFQRMVKEGTSCQRLHSYNQLQPWEVRRNQSMALQKFKANKCKLTWFKCSPCSARGGKKLHPEFPASSTRSPCVYIV